MDSDTLFDHTGECAALLSMLGNEKRLTIMCHLIEHEMSVGAIADEVFLSQSALSQHLAKLRVMGLVTTRRERQTIYYSCCSQHVRTLIGTLCAMYAEETRSRSRAGAA